MSPGDLIRRSVHNKISGKVGLKSRLNKASPRLGRKVVKPTPTSLSKNHITGIYNEGLNISQIHVPNSQKSQFLPMKPK